MPEKIGILAGMEWDHFPVALIERLSKVPGIHAELARIDATPEKFASQYHVLVDRISHEVPFYRFHLKAAVLAGTYVINDPFWFSADDKFFGYSLAAKIGVPVPRTMLLPQKAYVPTVDLQRSLKNLVYPLDWEAIAAYVGFPAFLKPADGGGWRGVSQVKSLPELWAAYDVSGTSAMVLQSAVKFDEFVRCICIGKDEILPLVYDPANRRYLHDAELSSPAMEAKIVDAARKLNHALGYDMNSVEFAVADGVPYAIDFTNPAPDMYPHHIGAKAYEWCLDRMAALCVAAARAGRTMDGGWTFQRYLARQPATPTPLGGAMKVA